MAKSSEQSACAAYSESGNPDFFSYQNGQRMSYKEALLSGLPDDYTPPEIERQQLPSSTDEGFRAEFATLFRRPIHAVPQLDWTRPIPVYNQDGTPGWIAPQTLYDSYIAPALARVYHQGHQDGIMQTTSSFISQSSIDAAESYLAGEGVGTDGPEEGSEFDSLCA